MKRSWSVPLALFAFLLATARAQDEDFEPRRCISLGAIDRTEIIDDQHIVFHMRNGDIYVNQLDRKCPTLGPGEVISYRAASRQLCNVDMITVLPDFPRGRGTGITCGLGMFAPSDEDLLAILRGDEQPPEIVVTDIEAETVTDDEE